MSEEAGYDDEYDDDLELDCYWQDEPIEPNCFPCGDTGWLFDLGRETGRACRWCTPSRLALLRWRVAGWFRRSRSGPEWTGEAPF